MKTYSFIGSDKNAGKTTAFNYVYHQLYQSPQPRSICLSSIGINGEDADTYEGIAKPHIELLPGSYFITNANHLADHTGKYQTLLNLGRPLFSQNYIFGKALLEMQLVLEGPNTGNEIRNAKQKIKSFLEDQAIFLIDGSIDRQFLARPEISDGFYFSVLFTKRAQQFQKSCDFLHMVSLAPCSKQIHQTISENLNEKTKSLLLTDSNKPLYHGETMVSRDRELRSHCQALSRERGSLYLKGALTSSLYDFLAPFAGLEVILDNFTLYHKSTTSLKQGTGFKPKIVLFHPVVIKAVFIKQETDFDLSMLPTGVIARNLFREIGYEG
jgi:hypothetical protein